MSVSYARAPIPVDARREDWPRIVAQDLNGILRGYIFAMEFIATPTASEVLWIHPCAASFSIPANWGNIVTDGVINYGGVIASVDTLPTASFALDVQRKPLGSAVYASIGTWTIDTGGLLTAITAGGKQIDIAAGDVLKWIAPSVADTTIAEVSFTVIGKR